MEEWMHLACYRAGPDVQAVLHCHPPLAIAWAATGEDLRAFSPETVAHLGPVVPIVRYAAPGSRQLADLVGKAVADGARAVLLANHGILTVGRSLSEAFDRACVVEAATTAAVHARLLGAPLRPLTLAEIDAVRERVEPSTPARR
jgi:L-fuculose-phosphate aldolase